jgi:hypothetical protein
MKLYGYTKEGKAAPEPWPLQLEEATIAATPEELRSIAEFFLSCAQEMEEPGAPFDHAHLSLALPQFRASPDLIVASGDHDG